MSGFTYNGNWIGLNFKITIGNYKSSIFPEGGVVLLGVGGLIKTCWAFFFLRVEIHLGRVLLQTRTWSCCIQNRHTDNAAEKTYPDKKGNSHIEIINDVING